MIDDDTATEIAAARSAQRPVNHSAARGIVHAFRLALWNAGVDQPDELREFEENGSYERWRLSSIIDSTYRALRERTTADVVEAMSWPTHAVVGYMKFHGERRDPVENWSTL